MFHLKIKDAINTANVKTMINMAKGREIRKQ